MRLFGKKEKRDKDCTCGGNCQPLNKKEVKETSCCDVNFSPENIEKSAREALAELNVEENIDHITDFSQIASYGVMSTPALVVKGKVVSYGKVLNKDEVKELLEENGIN